MKGGDVPAMNALDLSGPGLGSFQRFASVEFFEIPDLRLPAKQKATVLDQVEATSLSFEIINGKGTRDYGPEEVVKLPPDETMIRVSGFACEPGAGTGRELFVDVDGRSYQAQYGLSSLGVAAAAGRPEYKSCGFRWMAPLWRLGSGRHELRLRLRGSDGSRDLVSLERLRVEIAPPATR
jgi:hypothetical protein